MLYNSPQKYLKGCKLHPSGIISYAIQLIIYGISIS